MSTRERGILIGLAIVLAAGMAFILWKSQEKKPAQDGTPAATDPEGWDTTRLPAYGKPLRTFKTPGGVLVQVYEEGKGDPVKKGQAMDIQYRLYSAVSGAQLGRGTHRSLILERGGVVPGWIEGLQGTKPREVRRLMIPAAMGYGSTRHRNLPPNSDLVYDVEWVQLERDDLRVGTGKEARRGSSVRVHYKGTLENGMVFDSSYIKDKPITFTLKRGGLIDGWVFGVPGMKEGGIRKLWIPYHLAYNDQSKKPNAPGMTGIPSYSNLEFTIELLEVQ